MTREQASAIVAKGLKITGNSYPHKDAIKAKGCAWDAASKAWYAPSKEVQAECQVLVDGTLYNSPPPADLTGDESPVALAAKHGRTAVADAKITEWDVYGLAKGDNGKPNGSIRVVKGKRYVQVARTPRRYLSRDWLEDMDLFSAEPGGSYQWSGVEVEPTTEESAADRAAKEAQDAKAAAPKLWDAAVARIDQTVANRPAWVTSVMCVAEWHRPVMIHTGAYPAIYIGDSEVYYHVPGYFACDWDYPAVHRVAPLTEELRAEILAAVGSCQQYGFVRGGK